MAELIEIIKHAGFVGIETGEPVDILAGAKGEPPARPFEPFGIAIRAIKPSFNVQRSTYNVDAGPTKARSARKNGDGNDPGR